MSVSIRPCFATFAAALLLAPPALSFYTPLSEEAVREAYFLGQRHDDSLGSFLGKYVKQLPKPKTGPYISSISFFTPFVQIVQFNARNQGNYSAQQAELDHQRQIEEGDEIVQIFVEIQLTTSYGRLIPTLPNSRPDIPNSFVPRPYDFWKDFQVRIYNGETLLLRSAFHGYSNSNCYRDGPCFLTGATLEFELPATAFDSDTATIEVVPPEGDPVSVTFNVYTLL